jgi:hypothetical protein
MKYEITLRRRATQWATVEVEARSEKAARRKAPMEVEEWETWEHGRPMVERIKVIS